MRKGTGPKTVESDQNSRHLLNMIFANCQSAVSPSLPPTKCCMAKDQVFRNLTLVTGDMTCGAKREEQGGRREERHQKELDLCRFRQVASHSKAFSRSLGHSGGSGNLKPIVQYSSTGDYSEGKTVQDNTQQRGCWLSPSSTCPC